MFSKLVLLVVAFMAIFATAIPTLPNLPIPGNTSDNTVPSNTAPTSGTTVPSDPTTGGNSSSNGAHSGNGNGSGSGDDNDNGTYGGVQNSCSGGTVQCCDSFHNASDDPIKIIASLLSLDISDVTAQVGLGCTPVSVIAIAGNSCTKQSACCTNNSFNGDVAAGCSPLNANL